MIRGLLLLGRNYVSYTVPHEVGVSQFVWVMLRPWSEQDSVSSVLLKKVVLLSSILSSDVFDCSAWRCYSFLDWPRLDFPSHMSRARA